MSELKNINEKMAAEEREQDILSLVSVLMRDIEENYDRYEKRWNQLQEELENTFPNFKKKDGRGEQ